MVHKQISISSSVQKHKPSYNLTVKVSNPSSSKEEEVFEISAPFMRWFNSQGFFVPEAFQSWIASSIPVIGKSDPSATAAVDEDKETSTSTTAQDSEQPVPPSSGKSEKGRKRKG